VDRHTYYAVTEQVAEHGRKRQFRFCRLHERQLARAGLSAIFLGGTVFGSTVLHAVSPFIHDEPVLEILKITERVLVFIAASLLVCLVGLNAYKLAKRETSKLE
jgi:hypothetical protein